MTRPRLLALAFASLLLAASARAGEPRVEYDRSPTTLLVKLSQGYGEAAGDPRRELEIWGDGRVVVRRPIFVKGSKEASMRLTDAELDAVMQGLAQRRVLEFDVAAVREELRKAKEERGALALAGQGVIYATSDPDPSRLEVNVTRYLPEGEGDPVLEDVSVAIDWSGLEHDARFYPELRALRDFADAQRELSRLFQLKEVE